MRCDQSGKLPGATDKRSVAQWSRTRCSPPSSRSTISNGPPPRLVRGALSAAEPLYGNAVSAQRTPPPERRARQRRGETGPPRFRCLLSTNRSPDDGELWRRVTSREPLDLRGVPASTSQLVCKHSKTVAPRAALAAVLHHICTTRAGETWFEPVINGHAYIRADLPFCPSSQVGKLPPETFATWKSAVRIRSPPPERPGQTWLGSGRVSRAEERR